ncbi:MAG TPA: phosphatase PAP2 family protein [Gemmatimonadaceae bacterium]
MILVANAQPSGLVERLLAVVPWLGTNLTLGPLAALVALLCWRRGRRDLATWIAVVELGCLTLNYVLKELLERDRPDIVERVGWFGWASYPSGHAMAATAVLLTLAVALWREKSWTWPLVVAIPLPALIAYSRIHHGVHWPTDIVGGALVGMVWLVVTLLGFGAIERRKEPRGGAELLS